jgi:hypothetical protein
MAKRQRHALAMGDAINAHARAAGLLPETHGAAQNLPCILGRVYPDDAALERAFNTSGGGTALEELRTLLEQRQQSLKVAHRLFVAHQSATAMRASATKSSSAPAVRERVRVTEGQQARETNARSPGRSPSGVRQDSEADGKGTDFRRARDGTEHAPRVSTASLAWRDSSAVGEKTRLSRGGDEESPSPASSHDFFASTRIASVQQSALEQLRQHHLRQLHHLQALQALQRMQAMQAMPGMGGLAMGGLGEVLAAPGGLPASLALGGGISPAGGLEARGGGGAEQTRFGVG